ncbi:hypothetical protein MKZ38_008427 [Zalerion maritima]|uniref:Uncharacterized protein n=1 Tax=Zalerion maritima TaxID=339359 RepID=A0AAD5RH59_9PEZI|nr:hypothetical protein MKZ38_008427 [Zalerion maritima]
MDSEEWKCKHEFAVKIYYGWNIIYGVAHGTDCDHHNVLHLTLQRDAFDCAILWFLQWLPATLQAPIRYFCPGYFLPPNVILKKLKPEWDEEFDREKTMYKRLRPLQGRVIPMYHGEARCDRTRAIILEEIGGVPPYGLRPPFLLPPDEYRRRLEVAYQALCGFGVMTGDDQLGNTLILDDKVVFVDLENLFEVEDYKDLDGWVRSTIKHLVDRYKVFLQSGNSPRGRH